MFCCSSNKGVTLCESPKFLCLLSFYTSLYSPFQHLSPSLKPLNSPVPSFGLLAIQAYFHPKAWDWPHLPPSDTSSVWPQQNAANSLDVDCFCLVCPVSHKMMYIYILGCSSSTEEWM